MPTNLVLGNVYKSSFICRDEAQIAWLDRYWKYDFQTGPGNLTVEQLGNALDMEFADLYKSLLNNTAEYRGVLVQRVTGIPPYEVPVVANFDPGPGIAGPIAMAKQTAGLISLYAAFSGRRYQGRQYVPFPSTSDDVGAGRPSISYVLRLAVLADRFSKKFSVVIGVDTAEFLPVLFHRDTLTSDVITTFRARAAWASQRRRGDYGRTNISPI